MQILGVYVRYETVMLALIVIFILSLIAQGKVRRVFNRYNSLPAARNIPAHQAAREMLLDNGSDVTVEAWILDFDGDLYGQTVRLEFIRHIRDEVRFDSLDALKAQIMRDAEATRACFAQ